MPASIPPKVPLIPTPLVMRSWCVNAPYGVTNRDMSLSTPKPLDDPAALVFKHRLRGHFTTSDFVFHQKWPHAKHVPQTKNQERRTKHIFLDRLSPVFSPSTHFSVWCGPRTKMETSIPPKVPLLPTTLVMRSWCVNAPYEGGEPLYVGINKKSRD